MGFWQRALDNPDWVAVIEPDGTEHKAGDLLGRVNQIVHALRERGLTEGDGIAALIPNGIAPQELSLAALQAGWYYTPINWHFTPPEIAYIVRDTQAKAFFVHERFADAGPGLHGQMFAILQRPPEEGHPVEQMLHQAHELAQKSEFAAGQRKAFSRVAQIDRGLKYFLQMMQPVAHGAGSGWPVISR